MDSLHDRAIQAIRAGEQRPLPIGRQTPGSGSKNRSSTPEPTVDDPVLAAFSRVLRRAWTALACALYDLGDLAGARAAAAGPVKAGYSCEHEVQAALVDGSSENMRKRIIPRMELLDDVTWGNRTFYRGRWRGSVWITGAAGREQLRKAWRLLD